VWDERGYSCSYERKPGYFVHSSFSFTTSGYVYNPETVDVCCPDKVRPFGMAYIHSSFDMKFHNESDRRSLFHKPLFLTVRGEWKKVGDMELRADGFVVYDVKGPGTYLSRRVRTVLPLMYKWAPLQRVGSHWITLSSLRPRQDYDVNVFEQSGSTFICLGQSEPIKAMRKMSTEVLLLDEGAAPTKIQATGPVSKREADDERPAIMDEYWEDCNTARVFSKHTRREDATAWLLQDSVAPLLIQAELIPLQRFLGRSGTSFIDVAPLHRAGVYFLCPSRTYITKYIPHASRYFTKNYLGVATTASYARHDGDEYQSKFLYPHLNAIVNDINSKQVQYPTDNARSENLVASSLSLPRNIVASVIRTHPDLYLWKAGLRGSAQWVHWSSIEVTFPPTNVKGDTVQGLKWCDIILRRGETHKIATDLGAFRVFCLNNAIKVIILQSDQNLTHFKISSTRRIKN